MIARTVKLYPTREQKARLVEWFQIGTGVWNWALGQFSATEHELPQLRATEFALIRATRGHAPRIGIDSRALQGIIRDVWRSWKAYRSGIRGRPRRKGTRNRLASLPFRQSIKRDGRRVYVPSFGWIRTRGQRGLPEARILTSRLHHEAARGWYMTLVLDAEPAAIPLVGNEAVGVDLGYSTLATLSNGEKIEHPNEFRRLEKRIGQAARSRNCRLLGRLQQSLTNARRVRNHAISRDLVSRYGALYVSRDNIRAMQRTLGKSVLNAGHGALLRMIEAKCRQAGRVYVEVPSHDSTRTCSSCRCLQGPAGRRGLSVREWTCGACGAHHDRDVNAAINTLRLGAVLAHESTGDRASEISGHH